MKPMDYQNMQSSVNGGHHNPALGRLLSQSNVMYCRKCGFASTDASVFEKHMFEHLGTKFYCFYCNKVSFSEAELQAHVKQHTSNYPYKCPHCGQGYMRRLCLVKHIERLHKNLNPVDAKADTTKISHVPVSIALSSATADPAPPLPSVHVTVPVPRKPAVRLSNEEPREKTLDTTVFSGTNGNTEHISLLNGRTQHNRALTVSLPDEVSIPAGCQVEFVEVKTVNGTKELKLRLVSQQENKAVISTVKSGSMGNGKWCQAKPIGVECPAVLPGSISKSFLTQISQEKSGFKRAAQEIINLDSDTDVSSKIPKIQLNPSREGTSGIRVAQRDRNFNAAVSSVISNRVAGSITNTLHSDNIRTNVSQRAQGERIHLIPQHSKRVSDPKTMAVKWQPEASHIRNNRDSKVIKGAVVPSHPCLNAALSSGVPMVPASIASVQVKPPSMSQSFPAHRIGNQPSLAKTPVLCLPANPTISDRSHSVRSRPRAGKGDAEEPENFPVISSVFSLSQPPSQPSFHPLDMPLHGIVMDKSLICASQNYTETDGTEQMRKASMPRFSQVISKESSQPLQTHQCSDYVKEEKHDHGIQHSNSLTSPHVQVKEETQTTTSTDNDNKNCLNLASKPTTNLESGSQTIAHVVTSPNTDGPQQDSKSENDISSKFLTVSLRRVQVGVWENTTKGQNHSPCAISKQDCHLPAESISDCAVFYPMPLKADQLVKRPGPNQPVVVLNHPKPGVHLQGSKADIVTDTGTSVVVPKCQILKMRLSKVMGQKYEVMGCTVRVLP